MQTVQSQDFSKDEPSFRQNLKVSDCLEIRKVTESTGFFYQEEVDIAVELVEERLAKGERSGYNFWIAELDGCVVGYTCFGPIACTRSSFDLFWIVVRGNVRGKGLGRKLLRLSEETVRKMGGTRLYIETSSRELYEPTRQFYLGNDYQEEARLKNFYAPGDDKVIYVKDLSKEERLSEK
ncbi:MAG: GNAT family N-acetyltransferase [Syntrophotaleaceae bacterium]